MFTFHILSDISYIKTVSPSREIQGNINNDLICKMQITKPIPPSYDHGFTHIMLNMELFMYKSAIISSMFILCGGRCVY